MMKSTISLLVISAAALTGCSTAGVAPDPATKASAQLEEKKPDPQRDTITDDQKERMIRLWSDVPDYVMRLRRDAPFKYKKPLRVVSSPPPSYPANPLLANLKVTILVAFVIDEKGGVEAARVLESDDVRFDQSAIAAVLKWKFRPAEFEDGPTKAFLAVPVHFDGG